MERRSVVRIPVTGSDADSRLLAWLAIIALCACSGAVLSGIPAGLTYITDQGSVPGSFGLTLQHLRPLHESFAFAWVFLGGVAVVYLYLRREFGPMSPEMRWRTIIQMALWMAAGSGILVTLLSGRFTGREYFGYSPVFSLLILAGWILFAWNYFRRVGVSLKNRPVYIYMWSVAIFLFAFTYLEGHLYLLDAISLRPVRDIAIQWKSAGSLIGSFNLLAYGSLIYVSGSIRGDHRYAHSRTAFSLLFIGVLNSFTNFGHHTYHLPQSSWIHWISFGASMFESIILLKVFLDLLAMAKISSVPGEFRLCDRFFRYATYWTFLMLLLAVAISVPPVNALIHGTHVVVAHSMGSMIGIDSMILWGAFAYILWNLLGSDHPIVRGIRVRSVVPALNLFLFLFWLAFLLRGIAAGWSRYWGASAPDLWPIIEYFPAIMVGSGVAMAALIMWILVLWCLAFWFAGTSTSQPTRQST